MKNTTGELSLKLKRAFVLLLTVSLIAMAALPGCSCAQEEPAAQEEIPNIVGMTQADAERMITGYGFTVGKITEEESTTVANGMVVSQALTPGTMTNLGATIDFVVSKGTTVEPKDVKVPDLTGMTQSQAEEALFAVNLVPVPKDPVTKEEVAPGKVFMQSVEAGSTVKEGTQVSFTAALGSATVAVPQVTNLAKDAAVKALTDIGLNVDVHEEYNATIEAGKVSSQNPYANVHVLTGTTIVLTVSKGKIPVGKVEVPNFVTQSLPQAIQAASQAGLVIVPSGTDLNGVAVSQSPAAGTQVDPGTTVSISFGQPDV